MSWTAYTLTLRLRGDIHCGSLPLGFVARTHAFVPCHIPFFALVPAAVEALGMPACHASYMAVEELFGLCLRCTPLYVRHEDTILFPWDDGRKEILEALYLGSRYGVAIEGAARSARQGCLYETEVILANRRDNAARKNKAVPTTLEGALFVREGASGLLRMAEDGCVSWEGRRVPLQVLLDGMRLGGDRTRALGLPARAVLKAGCGTIWDDFYAVGDSDQWPTISVPSGKDGPLPLAVDGADGVQGVPTVLTGRRHTRQGAGMGMEAATVAYAPGWKIPGQDARVRLSQVRCATLAA